MFPFFAPEQSYPVAAADFDGTNDYLTYGGGSLTGYTTNLLGTFSCWVRFDGGDGVQQRIISSFNTPTSSTPIQVQKTATNRIRVTLTDNTNAPKLEVESINPYTASATWLHILFSWTTTSAKLYINDVDQTSIVTQISWTTPPAMSSFSVGASSATFSYKVNGALAEVFLQFSTFIDLTVESTRRKFISHMGKPVDLGANGSVPLGATPKVYLHLTSGESAANFATNRGSSGNLTLVGALDTASTSPSD